MTIFSENNLEEQTIGSTFLKSNSNNTSENRQIYGHVLKSNTSNEKCFSKSSSVAKDSSNILEYQRQLQPHICKIITNISLKMFI